MRLRGTGRGTFFWVEYFFFEGREEILESHDLDLRRREGC